MTSIFSIICAYRGNVFSTPSSWLIFLGDQVDLGMLPIQSCWPGEPAPLITWGVCVTQGKGKDVYNLGIYRLQVLGPNKVIVRWLKHRGGAEHYRSWQGQKKMPISVIIGADPATLLAAVMPIPENISEYNFSGLIRKKRLALVKCRTNDILVPAYAEIVLEGYIDLEEIADEGPYGDHTGFYNLQFLSIKKRRSKIKIKLISKSWDITSC